MRSEKRMLICLVCFLFCLISCFDSTVSRAASKMLSTTEEKNYVFVVPDGGMSSVKISVTYSEYYTPSTSTNTNKFTSRCKMYTYNMAYATTKPKLTVGNVIHFDGNGNSKYVHSSWEKISILYDSSKWSNGAGYENTVSRTYSNTTPYTGKLLYTITVSGALVPMKSGTLVLKLATK